MKAVLISIQPKWCELIASGKKTVEVRKTKPKLETPFKCYIYCTKNKEKLIEVIHDGDDMGDFIHRGKPNFIKTYTGDWSLYGVFKGGKVIGEFVCEEITDIHYHEAADGYSVSMSHPLCDFFAESTCLKYEELHKYLQGNNGYGWHITDLVIYDKPKELSEFKRACPDNVRSCAMCRHSGYSGMKCAPSIKAPQSWCYVEERSNDERN